MQIWNSSSRVGSGSSGCDGLFSISGCRRLVWEMVASLKCALIAFIELEGTVVDGMVRDRTVRLEPVMSEQDELPSSIELDFRARLDGGRMYSGHLEQCECLCPLSEIPWSFTMMLLEHQDIVAEFCGPSRWKELSKESSKILPLEMDPAGRRKVESTSLRNLKDMICDPAEPKIVERAVLLSPTDVIRSNKVQWLFLRGADGIPEPSCWFGVVTPKSTDMIYLPWWLTRMVFYETDSTKKKIDYEKLICRN
ncbi:hypothetical protein Tco_1446653 [Tanacetum coccineum]